MPLSPEDSQLIAEAVEAANHVAVKVDLLARAQGRNTRYIAAAIALLLLGSVRYTAFVACDRSNAIASQMSGAFLSAVEAQEAEAKAAPPASTTTTTPAQAERTRQFFADFGRLENCAGVLP